MLGQVVTAPGRGRGTAGKWGPRFTVKVRGQGERVLLEVGCGGRLAVPWDCGVESAVLGEVRVRGEARGEGGTRAQALKAGAGFRLRLGFEFRLRLAPVVPDPIRGGVWE